MATFFAPFLADAFLALLFGAAFCGVAWADPVAGAAAAATFGALLTTLLEAPAFAIFFDPTDFFAGLLVTFFAPAGLALAIRKGLES